MAVLEGVRIAVIATDGFEESELTEPLNALRDAGAQVDVLAPHPGEIQGFRHHAEARKVRVDCTLGDADPAQYDGVVLPGGSQNANRLRVEPALLSFLRAHDDAGKPIGAICHAPLELVSAGLVSGRKLTSHHSVQDDIRSGGGTWDDQEVIEDGNLITSRSPADLPAFDRALIRAFARRPSGGTSPPGSGLARPEHSRHGR